MQKMLESLNRKLQKNPDNVYYRWYGTIFSEQDVFTRLDKTYLYVVLGGPTPKIQRVIGYSVREEGGEPWVHYSTETCYRITSGNRKGRVLPKHRIFQNESIEIAGIKKQLEIGEESYQLNDSMPTDIYLLHILTDLDKSFPEPLAEMQVPDLFLSCPRSNRVLYPRESEDTVARLKQCKAYNEQLTLDTNLRRCLPEFAVDAGKGRVGYPFEHIFGKGIVVSSPEIYGTWFSIHGADINSNDSIPVEFSFICD